LEQFYCLGLATEGKAKLHRVLLAINRTIVPPIGIWQQAATANDRLPGSNSQQQDFDRAIPEMLLFRDCVGTLWER
jgi:hypothetical protein